MRDLPPLILARNLTEIGASPRPLSVAHKAGSLLRIRHGVYVDAADWSGLSSWEQYRLRIDAVAETCRAPTIFSHHSAAATWDIPTILRRQPIHALTTYRGGGRSRAGVRRHLVDPSLVDAEELDGLLVTSRIQTVLDLAAFVPFAEALVPLDHVLKPDAERGFPALSKDGLLDALAGRYPTATERRVVAAIKFADPASASAGESYSRGLIQAAGFTMPALQYEVRSSAGRIGYSDFYWEESRTVGEFDGIAKYQKPEYLNGRTPGQVVVDEKLREDRIRATGRNVVRWVWADLWNPGELERKLTAAGVSRRRPLSSGHGNRGRTQRRPGDT